ncbi:MULTISPECIES: hypothetical protein [Actinomycetes]|uniref:hypothetical protein n=1 Tax=Actinomycetes TaxID=1760 RepID=UPI00131A38A9|nr:MULTISPECIES: hypothetical protein [Actinomycetes]
MADAPSARVISSSGGVASAEWLAGGCGGTVDYLVDAVFNYPTLSEAYKVAALDATNKIRALERFAG